MLEQHILVLLFWFLEANKFIKHERSTGLDTKNESELDITDAMDALWRLRSLDILLEKEY
jgi:hypothetical protein